MNQKFGISYFNANIPKPFGLSNSNMHFFLIILLEWIWVFWIAFMIVKSECLVFGIFKPVERFNHLEMYIATFDVFEWIKSRIWSIGMCYSSCFKLSNLFWYSSFIAFEASPCSHKWWYRHSAMKLFGSLSRLYASSFEIPISWGLIIWCRSFAGVISPSFRQDSQRQCVCIYQSLSFLYSVSL